MMTYNRCIGTRYCANNCPFKVRRFNWADYTGSDSFKNNQDNLNDVVMMMNDDLTRMVLNPDVTVRARGVIEKCTFCVQRISAAGIQAKTDNKPFADGELKPACVQSCPATALVFGDLNDPESAVSRLSRSPRGSKLLDDLGTQPKITYLARQA